MQQKDISRIELARYLICPSLFVMLILMIAEAMLTATTTWLVINAGRKVASGHFLLNDLIWILSAQSTSYVAGVISWIFAERAANQEHQHSRERCNAEAGAERGRKRQGRDREGERQGLPERRHMGNKQADRRRVNRPGERADDVVEGSAQRPADAHLRHDHGGQHHPRSMQREV